MKPATPVAMRKLIMQIREAMPFALTREQICSDSCAGCAMKLLIFLETELDSWEQRLLHGARPDFGDLNKLASTSKKIYKVLRNNGLCSEPAGQDQAKRKHTVSDQ